MTYIGKEIKLQSPRKRYLNDPRFRALVDMMGVYMHASSFTPYEIRAAAILASMLSEEQQIRRLECPSIPKSVEKSLSILHEWTDSFSSYLCTQRG